MQIEEHVINVRQVMWATLTPTELVLAFPDGSRLTFEVTADGPFTRARAIKAHDMLRRHLTDVASSST